MARKKIYIADNLPIKTINGTSVIGNGDITISGSNENLPIYQGDIISLGQSKVTSKVMYSQSKNIYYSFEAGKLRTSLDFETWSRPVDITPSLDFIAVYEINAHFFVALTTTDVYTSTDMINWTLKSSPSIRKMTFNETHYVALCITTNSTTSNTILISTDLINWTTTTLSIGGTPSWGAASMSDIIFDGTNFIISGSGRRFIYSSDNGTTWTLSNQTFPTSSTNASLALFKGVLYSSSGSGKSPVENPLSISTDGGINWTSHPAIARGTYLTSIAANKDLIAIYGGGANSTQNMDYLWISTDGINFIDKSTQLKAITNINNEYPVLGILTDKSLMIRASSGRLFKINK